MKTEPILFGYSYLPLYGRSGDDGGFSIVVYRDGRLIHKTYIFSEIDNTTTEYQISEDSIFAIKALMQQERETIGTFDNCRNSCDGSENSFIFDGKQIIIWNIDYTNPSLLASCEEKSRLILKQHNKILSLFFKVTKILQNDGIDLDIHEVNFTTNQ